MEAEVHISLQSFNGVEHSDLLQYWAKGTRYHPYIYPISI